MTMRGPASTLSACAHVHTHYKKAQWCMFGGSTPRGGGKGWDVLPSSTEGVGHNGEANCQESKLQLLDTCRGAIGVLQTMSHTSL